MKDELLSNYRNASRGTGRDLTAFGSLHEHSFKKNRLPRKIKKALKKEVPQND